MNILKIATLPLDITWADRDENVYALTRALKKLPSDTDIVALPETFDTGSIVDTDIFNRTTVSASADETLDTLRRLARKHNMALTGSVITTDVDGSFRNRGFFIEPAGDEYFYDKHHLFGLSSEAEHFTAGRDAIPVIRYRGWNIALAVCYDLRFPAWLRNTDNKYDVLIIPANWPEKRAYAWKHLLIARAIENQAYVVGANRAGSDDFGNYDGLTYVFDYVGKPILEPLDKSADTKPEIGIAVCDRAKITRFREAFPVANDADRFTII